jgi:glycosyltransferase involved in cell wall biosynthesis
MRAHFPTTWDVDPHRVHFTRWCHGLTEAQLTAPVENGGYVFAGGDSLRNYAPLIEAACRISDRIVIATRTRPGIPANVPENVVVREFSEVEYFEAMRRASAVVVALEGGTERSAGQNNYLNPMAMGKAVIVTDATGVQDYVQDGETGIVVPNGDASALARALDWVLPSSDAVRLERLRQSAREKVLIEFSPERYVDDPLALIDARVSPG